ncbi:MAG: diacylglycerol kinase family protein [Dokdonella sp.]
MPSINTSASRYVIVINAASGSNDCVQVRASIVERLTQAGCAYEFVGIDDTSRIQDFASKAAKRARYWDAQLVAVGGDGTINAVVAAALEHKVPLAILPQGTFNFFGRTHGIPETINAGIDVLLHGRLVPVQIARVNDRSFIVNASLGLYPQVLEDREAWKQRFGRSRWIALFSGLATLVRGYHSLRLEIIDADGETRVVRTPTLVVANNALQLELIGIGDAPTIDTGHLVAITLKHVGKLQMIGLILRGALGKLGEAERVQTFGFRRMTVKTRGRNRRFKIALDGEISRIDAPLVFEAMPDALQLLVPQPGEEAVRA